MSSLSAESARSAARLWKELGSSLRASEERPLAARLADAAREWSGASAAALYLREKDGWVLGSVSGGEGGLDRLTLPETAASDAGFIGESFWIPLGAEGEVHGQLGLSGIEPDGASDVAALLGFAFGALLAAHRLARQVKDADFEVRTRLLELESLYDLGLSLGGQLDLGTLSDEVLFRSISLTDAGKGTLVLFDDGGKV
ncbi:MAG TPA: hypothetical protein VIZ69_12695, partial [Thermoanaerobaculia bacterium]